MALLENKEMTIDLVMYYIEHNIADKSAVIRKAIDYIPEWEFDNFMKAIKEIK